MGADIYLQSVWKSFEEKLSSTPLPPPPVLESNADFEAFVNSVFDEVRASGGYFRNGYNSGDVMWAMGLSWSDTVAPMRDERGYLPVEGARELVEMIEARPLTHERVGAHIYKHMTGGVEEHPSTGPLIRFAEQALVETPREKLPPDFEPTFAFLNKRRDELLAILRKSIELNEPLLCSL